MRQGSLSRGLLFVIFLILVISLFSQGTFGQSQEKRILDEIGEDWPTDIILIYVETTNKYNLVYRTNITDKEVLDEISAIEEAMDPQKEDDGEQDDVTFVLSISTLIKELNEAPKNIMDAIVEELDPVTDPDDPPGDHDYAIPSNQDEIDELVDDIPTETLDIFVTDTNDDGIWDTGVIWIGTQSYSKDALKKLDNIINKYHIDPEVTESDFNSQQSWWVRIDSGTIHCQISNLGYTRSYESHYGQKNVMIVVLIMAIIFILASLLIISVFMINSKMKSENKPKKKKKIMLTLMVFLVLITANVLIGLLGNPEPSSTSIDEFSQDMHGGQMGLVIVQGSQGPGPDQGSRGSGSMKDIEILDAISRFENELENIRDTDNPGESTINSPLNIIDIMKMIKVPEEMLAQIPIEVLPPIFQSQVDEIVNTSFWDAIHIAGQIDSVLWVAWYGKSFQDSLINIFYNSLTTEMRNTFVNEDYSRSLIYFQIPMREEEQTNDLRSRINDVVNNHQPFIPTSNFVLVDSGIAPDQNIVMSMKIVLPFGILAVGLMYYILLLNGFQASDKKEEQSSQKNNVEGEAIFSDITDDEDTYDEEYYYPPPPPPKRP